MPSARRKLALHAPLACEGKEIAPHIPVFDKSNRTDGTFARADFNWDGEGDRYICPAGKEPVQFRRTYATLRSGITSEGTRLYRASKKGCDACELKQRCCPNAGARKVPRDLNEDARDVARAIAGTPDYERSRHRRKKVERLFAHLKRILRMARLRLRGPCGARDEFLLAATAQNSEGWQSLGLHASQPHPWPHNGLRLAAPSLSDQSLPPTPSKPRAECRGCSNSEFFNDIGRIADVQSH